MDTGDKIFAALGWLFVLYGVGGLVVTWVKPRALNYFPYNQFIFTGNLVPNNKSRTLVSLVVITFGLQLALSDVISWPLRVVLLVAGGICALAVHFQRKDA